LQQFDIILKDFVNWKLDNDEIIEKFRSINSSVFRRLEPVYAVLNYSYQKAIYHGPLNEDLETIFQVGLSYLNSQFEIIKIYYQTLFNSKCEALEEFGPLLNALLYINDFRSDIEKFENYVEIEELDEVEQMIEDMIAQKNQSFSEAEKALNDVMFKIVALLDYEYTSIIDIFAEIAKSLGIGLGEDSVSYLNKEI
jgi:hypothetical protein